MLRSKFRLYIDEVGNPDLKSSDNPIHRFLSLTGIILELNYVTENLNPQMESFKKKYFDYHPDEPVILHRKDIVNKRGVFGALRDKRIEAQFNQELLSLLARWQYSIITICIDKKSHKETYGTWRYNPYHYCLSLMLERYIFILEETNAIGDVLAESRGGKEDIRLKKSYNYLLNFGTDYITADRFRHSLTSCELKVKQKNLNISGLQLADLIAHPSWCEILDERGLFEREMGDFAKEIIKIIQPKYYQTNGIIIGRGKKFI